MSRTSTSKGDTIDVLLLHGMSKELIGFLKELLAALGARASTVLELPSKKMTQESKVDYYIKICRLPLVLMTFDETNKRSGKARLNVYDEIARCRELRRKDTIVLQEKSKNRRVEFPSNVHGQLVVIEFDRTELHKMIPNLVTELRSRGFARTETGKDAIGAGRILNRFLDDMDEIWDDELSRAWDKIHRQDYVAERTCALRLDDFFQHYQSVFDALIRKKKRGAELKATCDAALSESKKCAVATWEAVAEGKMRIADEIASEPELKKQTHKHQGLYDRAAEQLREGQKRHLTSGERLKHFKRVNELVDQYMNVTRTATSLVGRSR